MSTPSKAWQAKETRIGFPEPLFTLWELVEMSIKYRSFSAFQKRKLLEKRVGATFHAVHLCNDWMYILPVFIEPCILKHKLCSQYFSCLQFYITCFCVCVWMWKQCSIHILSGGDWNSKFTMNYQVSFKHQYFEESTINLNEISHSTLYNLNISTAKWRICRISC